MKRVLQALVLVLGLGFSQHANATTYPVINTLDSGAGSLRAAIETVNANSPGPHRIVFAIPSSGVQTIHLLSNLPEITTTVAIDGTTQPSYNQTPLIEVAGDAANLPFAMGAPNSSLKGMAFNNFYDQCVYITADACTVSSCFIGTNAAGTGTIPNSAAGIYVIGKRALIGGHFPAFRNVIAGNATGVRIDAAAGQDSVIGNYIGTDVTGTVGLSNQYGIITSAPGVWIEGNLISGNGYHGILTDCQAGSIAPGDGTRIYRNLIGTDASGTKKLTNGNNGIQLGCDYTIVGGIGLGNVISGNTDSGIYIDGGYSSYNQIRGNYIGVSRDGGLPLGNLSSGIFLPSSHDNVIGGSTTDGTGNVIGANNNDGITIYGLTATDNTIQGNAIGTSFNGALSLGNAGAGIRTDSDRTTIGGLGTLGNIIAHNLGGVNVNSVQNPVRGNSIFGNFPGFGIKLDTSTGGPTSNDSLDTDDGPNHLQNYPRITGVSQVGNQVRLTGYMSTAPNQSFNLDFYSNTVCNPYGYGEGETWLGSTNLNTGGTGLALFDISYPLNTTRGGYIFTGTATDAAGSTSEFSPCAALGFVPTAVDPSVVFALGASIPSPARGTMSLPFTLPVASRVSLRVYDVSGKLMATLAEGDHSAGPHHAEWAVQGVSAGMYFCKLQARANDGSGAHFEASRTVIVVH